MCSRRRCASPCCCSPASRSLTAIIGTGTAWLVTAYRFPGRDTLAWALRAAARVPDLHRRLRLCRFLRRVRPGAERAARADRLDARRRTPGIRTSARLAARSSSFRSCSIRTSSSPRARCSRRRARALFEVARTLGATRFMLARHVALPLARPALAVGLSLALMETLNDIGASRISRRAHADALDLHHLAQPLAACPAPRRSPA